MRHVARLFFLSPSSVAFYCSLRAGPRASIFFIFPAATPPTSHAKDVYMETLRDCATWRASASAPPFAVFPVLQRAP